MFDMEFCNSNSSLETLNGIAIYNNERAEKEKKKKDIFPSSIIKGCGKISSMWNSYRFH